MHEWRSVGAYEADSCCIALEAKSNGKSAVVTDKWKWWKLKWLEMEHGWRWKWWTGNGWRWEMVGIGNWWKWIMVGNGIQ
ncbi:hypothetical protein Tco_0867513 [Tanacetum coccineum]